MARYPSDDSRFARYLRPLNVLDDADNKLSPTKLNAWGGVAASAVTVLGAIAAWVAGHWDALEHVLSVAPVVGGYAGGAFAAHHFDKRERNLQAARMK